MAAPSHGGGRTASPVSTSSTAPSTPTCTTAIWAQVSASEAAAARTAMSTRSRRSPASTDRKRRSAATISGFGSGTLARGSELRSRWRRLAASSASTPAESRAASPTPIGDGDVPAAASAAGVVGPPGGSRGGVVGGRRRARGGARRRRVLAAATSPSGTGGGTGAASVTGGADAARGAVTVADGRGVPTAGNENCSPTWITFGSTTTAGLASMIACTYPATAGSSWWSAGPGEVIVGKVPQVSSSSMVIVAAEAYGAGAAPRPRRRLAAPASSRP